MFEKMESAEIYCKCKVMSFFFVFIGWVGYEVVRCEYICKAYGDRVVLLDVNVMIYCGDRIGIIGFNGAGKIMLLKMIAGEFEVIDGFIEMGYNIKFGYYV